MRVRRAMPWNEDKFFSFEEDAFIQLFWKSGFYSTHSKKSFSSNPFEKAVPTRGGEKSISNGGSRTPPQYPT
jgi:hypothetical protein